MDEQKRRRVCTSMHIDADVLKRLVELSKRTKVPQAEYFREGLEMALAKYEKAGE